MEAAKLADGQRAIGELIETMIRNFKKDPTGRKNVAYYQERLRRLDEAWTQFEATDNKLRSLEDVPLNHPYFKEEYYKNIYELTMKYQEIFSAAVDELSRPRAEKSELPSLPAPNYNNKSDGNSSATLSSIKRQNVMMMSLRRVLALDATAANLKLKEKLWEQIQELHFSIWETSQNPSEEGYDMDSYIELERLTVENFKRSAYQTNQGYETMQNNVLPLPKIVLPKFNGDYLKWRSFFDLFSQLVDTQKLPAAQKMWYLKANVMGEAEKLISHLSATSDNYEVAWNLLQDRYNNKRILVTSIMNQLLEQPSITSSAAAIKQLHDVTKECLHALQNIGINITSWDPILLYLLVKKLDRGTHVLYERSITNPKELQKITPFLDFLETHFQSLEAMGQKEKSSSKSCVSAASSKQMETACSLCKGGGHPLFRCQTFLKRTPSERLNYAQKQRLCVNCLKSGHSSKECTSRSCTKCNRKHNSLLHLENANHLAKQSSADVNDSKNKWTSSSVNGFTAKNSPEATSTEPSSLRKPEASSLAAAQEVSSQSYVLLSTAIVTVRAHQTEIECRALLDSGSQVNFVTERLVRRLGLSKQPSRVNIIGIGATNTKTQHRVNVALSSRINGFSTQLEALVLPRIVSPQPSQFIHIDEWLLPKNLTLADPNFNRPGKIDILLGAEHYHQLLAIGQIKLSTNLPVLQNTVFGWVAAGKVQEERMSRVSCGMCTTDETLEHSIARLWELEEVKTDKKSLSTAEKQCEELFAQHTCKSHENRFIVKIPFHQGPDVLGSSHTVALNRFLSLERRLQKNLELKAQYIKFMEEYESTGHMTKISAESILSPNYFIPHHCIVRPESSTTKLRVVFDASSKSTTGHSLNDLMYTGPTLQSELFSILLRFRFPRFVFTTDVEKMYRQIWISPEDRQFQLIIWRSDAAKPITYYQLNTVTYGTRAAPYLATKCLQRIAEDNSSRYPLASQFLQEN